MQSFGAALKNEHAVTVFKYVDGLGNNSAHIGQGEVDLAIDQLRQAVPLTDKWMVVCAFPPCLSFFCSLPFCSLLFRSLLASLGSVCVVLS